MYREDWFAAPVFYDYVIHIDNAPIEALAKCWKNTSRGRALSNVGGWQSEDIDLSKQEATAPLYHNIVSRFPMLLEQFKFRNSDPNTEHSYTFLNSWVNVNGKGNYNLQHGHPQSTFSGVYYVYTPDDCGAINFINPTTTMKYSWPQTESAPYETCTYEPKAGMLLLFPSWLEHHVSPNMSNEDRVSISFNIGLINKHKTSET